MIFFSGNLVKVVGKNFDDVISKAEGDSFVKFYAPWCGHCKAMAPAWEELADKYADDSSLIIANFDATANDIRKLFYAIFGDVIQCYAAEFSDF